MTTDQYYPVLDERPLRLVSSLYEINPDFFDSEECPYSPFVKELFKGELKANDFDSHGSTEMPSDDEITRNILALQDKMDDYWAEVRNSDKSSDKNTFFRVQASLLEKIVDMKERMSNIRNANKFTTEVMSIMEQILTPDQRAEVMARLQPLVGEGQ